MATSTVEFRVIEGWEQKPNNLEHKDVAAVANDASGRVFLHTRNDDRVIIYNADGSYVSHWGDGVFGNAHGITIGPDGSVYCVDNRDHCVRKFTPDGELLMTLGTPGQASDTGYDTSGKPALHHNETVTRVAGPFNSCTNLAVGPNGDLYVADGYGNARIHRFAADGTLKQSWGEIGTGPGEFHLPHGIWCDADGRVFVCDRENDRMQIFSEDGEYIEEWNNVLRPCAVTIDKDGLVYVAELWRPCEAGQGSFVHGLATEDHPGRMSIFDLSGNLLTRFGADSDNRCAPGNFIAPHGVSVDNDGNLYVAEVTGTYGVRPERVGPECADHQIQKFQRVH